MKRPGIEGIETYAPISGLPFVGYVVR